jgi:hypothetical protein
MDLLMGFRDHPDPLVLLQQFRDLPDQQVPLARKALKEIWELKVIRANRDLRGLRVQLEQDIKLQATLLLF